ncbi:calcium channel flower homolog [Babylonia areolata]|uniref:calcium channel flower homolog n=1 Tax=Babylonia areolata TaxID=304850 RepID=UPI003FCEF609
MGQGQSNAPISTVSNPPQDDGITWWCKIGAKGMCVLGGIGAVIAGLFRCITFTPLCLVAGIMLMLQGFFLILMEAPCCCQFLDFIQPVSRFSERRGPFQKALIYGLPAILPLILCFSVTSAIGCALVFASGGIYGIIALGKKADKETMMTRARGEEVEMKETLIANEQSASVQ